MPDNPNFSFEMPEQLPDISLAPEWAQAFYRQSQQGNHYVRINPKALREDQESVKGQLQSMAAVNDRLEKEIAEFKEIDLEVYNDLIKKKDEIMNAKVESTEDVERIREQIQNAAEEKIRASNERAERACTIARQTQLNNEFNRAFEDARVIDDPQARRMFRADLMDHVRSEINLDKGSVTYEIRDGEGPMINDQGKPMTLRDLVNSRRSSMPYMFGGTEADGGGSPAAPHLAGMSTAALDAKHIVDMTPAEKSATFSRLKPAAYQERLKREAEERSQRRRAS